MTILGLTDFASLLELLPSKKNFLIHLAIVLWSIVPAPFRHQMFLVASMALWSSLSSYSRSSRIRQCYMFFRVAFKSHIEWSHAQYLSTLTTRTLPITVRDFLSLSLSLSLSFSLSLFLFSFSDSVSFFYLKYWPVSFPLLQMALFYPQFCFICSLNSRSLSVCFDFFL